MVVAVVLGEAGVLQVVERATLDGAGRERKAGGVNDVQRDPEAGAEPEQGAGVLRDVGLIEGQFDGDSRLLLPGRHGGCYSVAAGESHLARGWTSTVESAKRAAKSRAVEGGVGYGCAGDCGRPLGR